MEKMKRKNLKPYVLPSVFEKRDDITRVCGRDPETYLVKGEGKVKVLYLHGGGYTSDPLPFHWGYILLMKGRTQADFYVPVYPKLPVYTYKEAFEQVFTVYKKILEETAPENIVFMGDSAGGGFVLALAQLIKEQGYPGPRDIIMLSPWLDITMSNPELPRYEKVDPTLGIKGLIETGKYWAGDEDPNNYLLSPINGDLNDLGRMSLFIGTRELLLPDARRFHSITKGLNIPIGYYEYKDMIHVFPFYPLPEAREANEIIADLIIGK